MKLSKLLNGMKVSGNYSPETEVSDIVSDSRMVKEGSLFVCIRGARFDGHSAAQSCLERGAAAVVVDHSLGLSQEIIVEDTRAALAVLCSNFFGRPQDSLKLIAVTGTNGKTTIANVIKQSLEACGKKAGLIGTIGVEAGDLILPAKFTTPEPWDMEMILRTMADSGCEYVVMEASSQALEQRRLCDLHFSTAIFTNLSQDHLDYHKTMDAYFEAKCILFGQCDHAVINLDDPRGKELFARTTCSKVGYAIDCEEAHFRAEDLRLTIGQSEFTVRSGDRTAVCSVPLPGRFSVYNALACIAAVDREVGDLETAAKGVSATRGVSGRCEILHRGKYRRTGSHYDTGFAPCDASVFAESALLGKSAVYHGHLISEIAVKPLYHLGRQGYLRNQHYNSAGFEGFLNEADIYQSLAAAGNAVKKGFAVFPQHGG